MPRTIHLHVMLSEEEMASLRSLSDSIDMTVSDTVRILIQAGTNSGPVGLAMLVFDRKTLVRYVRNVRSLGHLLNQSTHALNYIAKAVRESGVDALDLTEALVELLCSARLVGDRLEAGRYFLMLRVILFREVDAIE